jgi:biotin-(acetyl-CoA carboxylase) ligase
MHLQKKIKIIQDGNIMDEGAFKGINDDGSLLLQSKNNLKTYHFGEISIIGVY